MSAFRSMRSAILLLPSNRLWPRRRNRSMAVMVEACSTGWPARTLRGTPRRRTVKAAVTVGHTTETERVLEARAAYVARGVAVAPLVVARAEGARIWDVDGRSYVDFAGGIGCQNTGHGLPAVVAAVHDQVDRYLHQCFMVGTY